MEKIDAYTHFVPVEGHQWFERTTGSPHPRLAFDSRHPALNDAEARIELMDRLNVDRHVLVPVPNYYVDREIDGHPDRAREGARVVNEALAALVAARPDRFSAVATIPPTDGESMAVELSYAVSELGLVGGLVFAGPVCKPLDHPDFDDLFAAATGMDVPLWVHPTRGPRDLDVAGEDESKYHYYAMFGYVNEDTVAMTRLVFGGAFARHPSLKIVMHHLGGMVPFFEGRITSTLETHEPDCNYSADDFRAFYVDTAVMSHNPRALELALDFFGADRVLFGSDAPQDGDGTRHAVTADATVGAIAVSEAVREQIYARNARRLLRL